MAGTVGSLLVLIAFLSCALAGLSFFLAARERPGSQDWLRIGRWSWGVVTACSISALGLLIFLLLTHQFQYGYVYENSSRDLPTYFLVSSSWAGQEGSFLLWIIFNSLVGLALLRWARQYEATTMTVVALCQCFLLSMVIGVEVAGVPLGSSPFVSLADKFPDAPTLQAGLIPTDGSGLNDLLQNYWMVIHPPTLFIGFAAMIVPFAFAVSALWKRQYTQWVRPAIPWTLFAVMVLGVGVAMGGYWAYVTLSFGGYWAWDPVENSSLGPWLLGIAALHTMIIQKRSGNSHKASIFLSIVAYMLVVYSTFLTRSGILGDVSVHSFVDLGLYNQLLLWILTMGVVGFGLFVYRFKELPAPDREPSVLSREFMIFCGAMLICALAVMIILGTSAPIIGKVFRDNPSTVPIAFYNKWALPLSIGFVFLTGLAQLFWWHRMEVDEINRVVLKPIGLSVLSTVLVLVLTPFVERSAIAIAEAPGATVLEAGLFSGVSEYWQAYGTGLMMMLLLFVSFFALYGNGSVLWKLGRQNPKLAGGAITHVGFAIMMIGIVASSGFSNPIARGIGLDLRQDGTRDNFVLARGETRTVGGYEVSYAGRELTKRGRPRYLLNITDPSGATYTATPVVYQSNSQQWIQHPSVRLGAVQDLFVSVAPSAMFGDNASPAGGEFALRLGESITLGDDAYEVMFERFEMQDHSEFATAETEVAVAAVLQTRRLDTGQIETLKPIFLVDGDGSTRFVSQEVEDWQFAISFVGMNVETGQINLAVQGVDVAPEDWVVVQAFEKPLINLVWVGIILLTLGFVVSIVRRVQERNLVVERGVA